MSSFSAALFSSVSSKPRAHHYQHSTMHGEGTQWQRLSLPRCMCRACHFDLRSFSAFLFHLLSILNGFSKTSIFLKTLLSPLLPPNLTEKIGNTRCGISLSPHPHSAYTSCLWAFTLACCLTDTNLLCVRWLPSLHTQPGPQSLSQSMVCPHTSLPGLWTKSSFPSLDQPPWKEDLWQRENKWVDWQERAKGLWKKNLRCLCLFLYTKMQSLTHKTGNQEPAITIGQITCATG